MLRGKPPLAEPQVKTIVDWIAQARLTTRRLPLRHY